MGLFVTCLEGNEADLRTVLERFAECTASVQYNADFNVVMVQFDEETPEVSALKLAVFTNSRACVISNLNIRFVYTLRELEGLTQDEVKQLVKDDEALNAERADYFVA